MIQTSDLDQRGLEAPLVLAVLEANVTGVDITDDPVAAVMGELVVADEDAPDGQLVIAQVERRNSGEGIRLRRTATSVNFSTYFDDEGSPVYPNAKLFLQVAAAGPRIPYTIGATGGGFNNWTIDDGDQAAAVNGIVTGDHFLLAIATPAVQATAAAGGRHATRGSAGGANALTATTTVAGGRHATRGSAGGANALTATTTVAGGRHATRGSATGTNGQELPDGAWVRTVDGDVLDEICWRHYGREDAVPAVLGANPGLSEQGPALAGGLIVALPDLPDPEPVMAAVRLWDDA